MVQAVCADRLEEKTGYGSFRAAISAAKNERDGWAVWYCLEVVRPIIGGIVGQYIRFLVSKKLPSLVSGEDLEQAAFEVLIRSLERFEPPAEGTEIECLKAWRRYASMTIRSPVREAYARSMGPVSMPDWAIKIASQLNRAMRDVEMDQYEQALAEGRPPSLRAPSPMLIAAKAGIEYSKVKRFMDTGLHFLPGQRFSYDVGVDGAGTPDSGHGTDSSSSPEVMLTEGQEALLEESMQLLNSRQQYVIERLYGIKGRAGTYKSVGKELKLDPEQVMALERAAMAQLKASFMEDDEL